MESLVFSTEIGLIAGVFFVIAYGLLNFEVITADSPIYQGLNFLGALGFVYTAISPFNPGLFVVEAVWAVVALFGLIKIFSGKGITKEDKLENPEANSATI
ncbi:CBU_0592 family membrane protein [Corynebacterium cystitidis]|uniref:CBU-0592-like domain-containing protein n=1 Tax=Corynebacterium cystitidis DSM 20524 TaxID=1121357 RepID=A0A1H9VET7_9CORY|nr:transporter [Corynebacterium cystitidis]WJY82264.1 hypothetical protein CCYS_06665 [Corynebacterium cystitidis DSM 20524]SES19783.1 hypothetical protein SAMN05661109_02208 [Corynebacterium cystitidis DSM 20524]SNV77118.1 putative permease [Corynebacterium cystitidis]